MSNDPQVVFALSESVPQTRRWEAEWLWDGPLEYERNAFVLFRREFDLPDAAAAAVCRITASQRYRLWINGTRVGDGPPFCAPHEAMVDEREIGSFLCRGKNAIAVLLNTGMGHHTWRGGLLCEIEAGGERILKTDASWTCCRPPAWRTDTHRSSMNASLSFQEHFDAALLSPDWTQPGFDDADWSRVHVIGAPPCAVPWKQIHPREIPFPEEVPLHAERISYTEECMGVENRNRSEDLSISLSACGRPVELARIEDPEALLEWRDGCTLACSDRHLKTGYDGMHDPCLVLDFGRVITGQLQFECTAPAGAILEFGYVEDLIDGHFNNAIENQFADKYCCRDGRQSHCFLAWRAFRYLKVRLRNCPQALQLHRLEAVQVRYPFEERGCFQTSDETLNAVCRMCRDTIRLCAIDQFMDTPCRESAQWLGDVSAVTLGGVYACFGDTRLAEKFLRQSASARVPVGLLSNTNQLGKDGMVDRVIPDYSLWWIMALWQHYMYSGQAGRVRAYYPELIRIVRFHLDYLNKQGLLEDVPGWVFIDWAPVEKGGCNAIYNALFTGALDAAEKAARLVEDTASANHLATLAATIRAQFEDAFLDSKQGLFHDARVQGALSERVSEHANYAALRWGCCSEAVGRDILERFDHGVEAVACQPFFASVMLAAMARYGRGDLGLRLIRERWGKRMLRNDRATCSEEWTINGTWRSGEWKGIMRTLSHAWSASPAEFLIRCLPGIEILEPGCKALRIAPITRELDFESVFPTPPGAVRVACHGKQIKISAPDGVRIESPPS
ncbi:MAG: family 78 glycoside hydrolase catalytic domain [Phycisphaerae bacterium]|nr:family 78 glycoside hydrolase catalytic domain [Phycisphaerae bacterium]